MPRVSTYRLPDAHFCYSFSMRYYVVTLPCVMAAVQNAVYAKGATRAAYAKACAFIAIDAREPQETAALRALAPRKRV